MQFSRAALRGYFESDFSRGLDFGPAWTSSQLVETKQVNGVFVQMDSRGAPKLKHAFANFMDENDSSLCASYGDIVAIFDAMRRPHGGTTDDDKLNHMHAALSWLAFDRRAGVTQEAFAERKGVTDRTVRVWLDQALDHIGRELKSPTPGPVTILPSSYTPSSPTGPLGPLPVDFR